jgi:hypothetical protein
MVSSYVGCTAFGGGVVTCGMALRPPSVALRYPLGTSRGAAVQAARTAPHHSNVRLAVVSGPVLMA